MEKTRIRVSVRNLVEFILRSGDIDTGSGIGRQTEAMQAGSRMHKKIQRRAGAEYVPEVPLKFVLDAGEYELWIEGRADGVIIHGTGDGEVQVTIDEIKSMYSDVTRIPEPNPLHLAQAKCYAWMYAADRALKEISVRLTYCSLETEEIRMFTESFRTDELKEWFEQLLLDYRRWTDYRFAWEKLRCRSIRQVEFPWPYREGQHDLVRDVYRTISRKKILFLQAPTGVGKTISTLFPAVKAMGEGLLNRIFYLTAKTVTASVAIDTCALLKEQGLRIKVIRLLAKDKLCPQTERNCTPGHCPRAKGHFDRVNEAVYELMTGGDDYGTDTILRQAEKHGVCPFEMALDLSEWSDVVVCDYNYAFDPNVRLKRFFAEGGQGEHLFLVDEAHNLVERGRKMFSAALEKEAVLAVRRTIRELAANPEGGPGREVIRRPGAGQKVSFGKLEKALNSCNQQLLDWKRESDRCQVRESLGSLHFSLMRLFAHLEELLREYREFPGREEVLDFFFSLRHFLNMAELLDDHYVIYTDFGQDGSFVLNLFCVDPSANLQDCLNQAVATVFFSATFLPIRYYKSLLSTETDNYAIYAKTAFSSDQQLLFAVPDVSTLYRRRNASEYERIAACILETVREKRGNYLVFCPSYQLMEEVGQQVTQQIRDDRETIRCLFQKRGMKEEEREAFLMEFSGEEENREGMGNVNDTLRKRKQDEVLLGFCVLGGIFSEGIDLREEQLIGALIVGTGLPQICTERELLRDYYDRRDGNGFSYAYLFPGMNKVQQAAGRVIRTIRDRGVIGLLDERFLRREYRELFPREWKDLRILSRGQIGPAVRDFWTERKEADSPAE